jgi:hypothetical protein
MLALVAAVIGLTSVADTLANVIAKADPARAHVLSPGDGHITADLAEQQFTLEPTSDPGSRAARLAHLALRQDATAVEALSVLGLQAQMRQDTEAARRLFTYSQQLSRRELRPRIWAIEEAVSRGDIAGALEQYDIALRTSRTAPDLLFPVLASAVAEPRVRAVLIEKLNEESAWGPFFIHHLAATAPDPQASVRFFLEAEQANFRIPNSERATLVNALTSKGLTSEAWSFYASFRPGSDQRRSRDPVFSLETETRATFDWTVLEGAGLSATIRPSEDGGLVDFSAAPSNGGPVLQQMQMLRPGAYRLKGLSSGVEQPERSLPYWSLTCQDGRELGRISLRNSPPASGSGGERGVAFNGRFNVPTNCLMQTLALVIRPSDQITGVTGQIHRVQLTPLSGRERR